MHCSSSIFRLGTGAIIDKSFHTKRSIIENYSKFSLYCSFQCNLVGFNMFFVFLGPKPKTVNDFWRMIFEHKCPTIVMLTTLKEMGKVVHERNIDVERLNPFHSFRSYPHILHTLQSWLVAVVRSTSFFFLHIFHHCIFKLTTAFLFSFHH